MDAAAGAARSRGRKRRGETERNRGAGRGGGDAADGAAAAPAREKSASYEGGGGATVALFAPESARRVAGAPAEAHPDGAAARAPRAIGVVEGIAPIGSGADDNGAGLMITRARIVILHLTPLGIRHVAWGLSQCGSQIAELL